MKSFFYFSLYQIRLFSMNDLYVNRHQEPTLGSVSRSKAAKREREVAAREKRVYVSICFA